MCLLISARVAVSYTTPATVITVDASMANQHSISPLIYGVSFGTAASIADLNIPLNRQVGIASRG